MQVPRLARQGLLLVVGFLAVLNIFIFHTILAPRELRVTVLDVGQGDAILVESPTGVKVLIDGGPDRGVLRELGVALPFWERTIDVVVATHPDKDHIGGLPDVFAKYEVEHFVEPGIPHETSAVTALAEAVSAEPGLTRLLARRGMRLDLGGGAYADILYPDRDPSKLETNFGAVVMRLVYGETSFLFTADIPTQIEDWLLMLDGSDGALDVDVLKVAHHGSKYSTSGAWLRATSPSAAAISVGAKNSYGHPTPEVLSRVEHAGARILRTDIDGRIIFTSDGLHVSRK